MEFKGTRGKWKHKKGKRAKFEYDNFIIDEYGNHIVKWSNTGNGSHKLTIKESHANGLLISKAPEMLEALKMFVEAVYTEEIIIKENYDNDGHENCGGRLYQKFKQLIKEATEL